MKRLFGRKSLIRVSKAEHQKLRRMTMAPISGHAALEMYIDHIEHTVISGLEEWSSMEKPLKLLTEIKELTFKLIWNIFMGSTSIDYTTKEMEALYDDVALGLFCFPINFPGFNFHKSLKVIDETLRLSSIAFATFREATTDININGKLIPKGWKVILWHRGLYMDEELHPSPQDFNPSRWDDFIGNPGAFTPFGLGVRLCPGRDLAKLEISIFLHHFLLNYKIQRYNPQCQLTYLPLPHPKDKCLARVLKAAGECV
ncbi:Beta-amyrin 11-oxidase, partial [Cucurbita argyrosperma subsp. sororia]